MDKKLNGGPSKSVSVLSELSDELLVKSFSAPVIPSDSEDEYETDTEVEQKKATKKSTLKFNRQATLLDRAIGEINGKLDNLRNWYDMITLDGLSVHRALINIEDKDRATLLNQKEVMHDRAVLFESTANAMVNSCAEFLKATQTQADKWADILLQQVEQREQLENIVEQLAKHQQEIAEKAAENNSIQLPTDSNIALDATTQTQEDDQLFDAAEIVWSNTILPSQTIQPSESRYITKIQKRYTVESTQVVLTESHLPSKEFDHLEFPREKTIAKARRSRIPERPVVQLNLWSFLKNCIGKDLSHVPMPVNFNEPISMLQRLAENFEYAYLLDMAAECDDECRQLAYVAAFSVSNYSSTADRIAKPFNPLLGETYECDRTDDMGWRCIAEQVSHHPPISAVFCEGLKWVCYQEFTMRSRFRVKYLQVMPEGNTFVEFKNTGHKYQWRKVTTTIHNIVVGKLWVDQEGESEIIGLKAAAGLKCLLEYIPYSYFSKLQQRCVKGTIINRNGEVPMLLRGSWDREMGILPVISHSGKSGNVSYVTGDYTEIWTRTKARPESEKMYNFTEFACQLNDMEEGVAPTDTRRRKDQRLMEEGLWDESNIEKPRLEEKQRERRRKTEEYKRSVSEGVEKSESILDPNFVEYHSVWFDLGTEEDTKEPMYLYNGTYWEAKEKQDWSKCPDLYS